MKETKVYVDELPEDCTDCPCYDFDICGCQCKDPHFTYGSINRFKGCPLIDIKVHDREVVKEVCEKIKNAVNKSLEEIGGNCNGELYGQYICKGLVDYDSIEFDEILAQIQKEFEDE